jgi:hypothetical protein
MEIPRADFLNKMRIALKELRETRIIKEKPLVVNFKIEAAYNEVNQLIKIFVKSIETAKANKIRRT